MRKTLDERFWEKVEKKSDQECWLWKASTRDGHYGSFKVNGRTECAHRVSWFLTKGEWPDKLILHKCDTPRCVNPNHMSLGTCKDNVEDMFQKGRAGKVNGFKLPQTKLSEEEVNEIRASEENQYKIAEKYGIRQSTVSRIKNGVRRYLVKKKHEEVFV